MSNSKSPKVLEFTSSELSHKIDLMFVFERPTADNLHVNGFPVCWKVVSFSATGVTAATIDYTGNTGLFVPQTQSGHHVSAYGWQHCEVGQKCTLKTDDQNQDYLTHAVDDISGIIQCVNETDHLAIVGLLTTLFQGLLHGLGSRIEPIFVWEGIVPDSTLSFPFTPVLKIYATSNYKAGELIRGDIPYPALFEADLNTLLPFTSWKLLYDPATGEIKIEAA
ncbi:hypothetical protein CVT25_000789 [Psilocybe cyanescens]|uniref:Uncharacterized protein n=1 Tax=Psilocybe cyanescens TaxID=93625 RepID=A0A409XM45_PSICY|nr:hypothetical protein CVT25_000789 [Psilocybe cyanescens]